VQQAQDRYIRKLHTWNERDSNMELRNGQQITATSQMVGASRHVKASLGV
jgi:hypothetical protein